MTGRVTEGTYASWEDSPLARKIQASERRVRLGQIWAEVDDALPRATWEGWVDHSQAHALSVLRNVGDLMPDYLIEDLTELEAFVLVAGAMLHDIGMSARPELSPAAERDYTELRRKHGPRGAEIVRSHFRPYLKKAGELEAVCEIVKNHQGPFTPPTEVGPFADLRALALWLRLADELDFGPHRAPVWLLDLVPVGPDELPHWETHNSLSEPQIDLDLFRIRISGQVDGEALVRKLRAEFEAPGRQDLQSNFLKRGQKGRAYNRFFLIWDCTDQPEERGGRGGDPRPAIFSDEKYFIAGSHLYSIGLYKPALRCFVDGIRRLGAWTARPAMPYFYHYLKTLITLGAYEEALARIEDYAHASFPKHIRPAISVAAGLARWKSGDLKTARLCFVEAAAEYRGLSGDQAAYRVDEADARVLDAAVTLGMMRQGAGAPSKSLTKALERAVQEADELFTAEEPPGAGESHYRGRFWGLKAFYSLFEIEHQGHPESAAWADALRFADLAHGGASGASRTPLGILCGKYCAAAVRFHRYSHCSTKDNAAQDLSEAADLIAQVRRSYDELFGADARVPGIWPQVHSLLCQILEQLPQAQRGRLEGFSGSQEPPATIEIYTPIR